MGCTNNCHFKCRPRSCSVVGKDVRAGFGVQSVDDGLQRRGSQTDGTRSVNMSSFHFFVLLCTASDSERSHACMQLPGQTVNISRPTSTILSGMMPKMSRPSVACVITVDWFRGSMAGSPHPVLPVFVSLVTLQSSWLSPTEMAITWEWRRWMEINVISKWEDHYESLETSLACTNHGDMPVLLTLMPLSFNFWTTRSRVMSMPNRFPARGLFALADCLRTGTE